MVAYIATHEDECVGIGGRPCQPAEMTDRVPGRIKEIEGAVTEEVKSTESSDLEGRAAIKVDLTEGAASYRACFVRCLCESETSRVCGSRDLRVVAFADGRVLF